jgi:hypothetical protein
MKRLIAWLLGARTLEKDEDHLLIRLPVGCGSEEGKAKIAAKIVADDRVKNPDKKPLKITSGYRLMRFEREK